jgi:hypothetical protein
MGETQLLERFLECEVDAVSASLAEEMASSINQHNRVPIQLLTDDDLTPRQSPEAAGSPGLHSSEAIRPGEDALVRGAKKVQEVDFCV